MNKINGIVLMKYKNINKWMNMNDDKNEMIINNNADKNE